MKNRKVAGMLAMALVCAAAITGCGSTGLAAGSPQATTAAVTAVLTRGVVSYKVWGEESVDLIDRIELAWSQETENWLHPDHSAYNEVQSDISGYHTLTMTIFRKDGAIGQFIFKGGSGTLGGSVLWNISRGGGFSSAEWKAGSYTWAFYDGNLVIPDIAEINPVNLSMRGWEMIREPIDPEKGKNKMIFYEAIVGSGNPVIAIELDGPFFPD